MNPTAAQELLDLIMLDDFVARKQALDNWSRKWIATCMVEYPVSLSMVRNLEKNYGLQYATTMAKAAIIGRMLEGIAGDESVKAMRWEVSDNEDQGRTRMTRVEMHVVLQEPRDIDAGKKAAQRMRDLASGSFEDPTSGE